MKLPWLLTIVLMSLCVAVHANAPAKAERPTLSWLPDNENAALYYHVSYQSVQNLDGNAQNEGSYMLNVKVWREKDTPVFRLVSFHAVGGREGKIERFEADEADLKVTLKCERRENGTWFLSAPKESSTAVQLAVEAISAVLPLLELDFPMEQPPIAGDVWRTKPEEAEEKNGYSSHPEVTLFKVTDVARTNEDTQVWIGGTIQNEHQEEDVPGMRVSRNSISKVFDFKSRKLHQAESAHSHAFYETPKKPPGTFDHRRASISEIRPVKRGK